MIALLADVNIEGHVARLMSQMQGSYWRDFWDHLQLHPSRFQDVGLSANDSDAIVWQLCQQQRLYLLTNKYSRVRITRPAWSRAYSTIFCESRRFKGLVDCFCPDRCGPRHQPNQDAR